MLERIIDEQLVAWRNADKKQPLIVRGARQIGKTTSIRQLGGDYESYIEVNFLEKPDFKNIFSGNLDVDTLIMNFSVYMPEADFIESKTLLFLDEIQECPEAITSLKFFNEDGRFDVIASGSMLGIDYKRPTSYPVGAITYLDMYPMTFEEFLWACNISHKTIEELRRHFTDRTKISDAINDKMFEYFRLYMVIGGMPQVVNSYVNDKNIHKCYKIQETILKDYRYDIAHYAPATDKIKAERCYDSIPKQLSKRNHKFQYSVVEKGGNARKYKTSLDWLIGAYLVVMCYNTERMVVPLKSRLIDNDFRLYASDIGLTTAMYGLSVKTSIISDDFGMGNGTIKGDIYEAAIADVLYKNGRDKLYFRKTENGSFEIEFLVDSNEGVVPVEVKAKNSRSKSLDNALKKDNIPYGYKLITGNIGQVGKKITIPLYMAMFI